MDHKSYSAGLADTGLKEPDNGSSQLGLNQVTSRPLYQVLGISKRNSIYFRCISPAWAAIITIIMLGAIVKVHGAKGFANGAGGFEYNAVLIAVSIGVALIGSGAYALHFNIQYLRTVTARQ